MKLGPIGLEGWQRTGARTVLSAAFGNEKDNLPKWLIIRSIRKGKISTRELYLLEKSRTICERRSPSAS
eukprot:g2610.t1